MREDGPNNAGDRPAPMGLAMSFFPYVVLSIAALGVLAIEPVNRALGAFSIGMPFPAVTTRLRRRQCSGSAVFTFLSPDPSG